MLIFFFFFLSFFLFFTRGAAYASIASGTQNDLVLNSSAASPLVGVGKVYIFRARLAPPLLQASRLATGMLRRPPSPASPCRQTLLVDVGRLLFSSLSMRLAPPSPVLPRLIWRIQYFLHPRYGPHASTAVNVQTRQAHASSSV